ncbi:MAG: SPFH domain-containing protein [Bacteroidia bacterium]|nr:SPFH domain-containing protein [Bacteroidia bacterium]MDW8302359.1 SPFH domain-containing protein [Bacteroidia bacterium]
MGLFSFLKNEAIDVIEWVDADRDTIIWKFPDNDCAIKNGAQLTVRESQVALVLNKGQIMTNYSDAEMEVFKPGLHRLSTDNMPIITKLKSWKYAFNSPFKVDIYFINTRQFADMKWGTPQPIPVRDPEFGQVQLRAFGTYTFRVSNPPKFFREVAGTNPEITSEEVKHVLRSAIISRFVSTVAKAGKSILDLAMFYTEMGEQLKPILQEEIKDYGIEITRFYIESISVPENIQKAIDEMTAKGIDITMQRRQKIMELEMQNLEMQTKLNMMNQVTDMNKFMQFQMANSMDKPNTSGSEMSEFMKMQMQFQMMNQMMNSNNMMNTQQKNTSPQEDERAKIMATLKELGELKAAGILTEEEFNQKKKELLSKL